MAFNDNIKRYGFSRSVGAWGLRKLERHLGLHIWVIDLRPTDSAYKIPEEHAAQFTFKRLTLNEAVASSANEQLGMSADFVRDAFSRSDVCLGVLHGDKLVAYAWRTFKRAPVTNDLWIRLCRDDVRYGYKAYVLPEYRGMQLYQSVTQFYEHEFAAMGINNAVGYTALNNLPSMRSRTTYSTQVKIGYAGFLKLGARYWTFRTPGVRAYLAFDRSR